VNGSLVFSPDGEHWAYVAQKDGKQFVVIDYNEQNPYDSVSLLAQGRIVFDTPEKLHYLALKDKKVYRVDVQIKKR